MCIRFQGRNDVAKLGVKEEEELGRYMIPIHDVSKFAKAVRGISQKGYDAGKVIEEFSELESARSTYWDCINAMPHLKMKYDGLNQEY